MKNKNNVRLVKLSDISETFVVRVKLNDDHVLYLASLLEAGKDVEPLLLSDEGNVLVDGRHRLAAIRLTGGIEEFPCEIRKFDSEGDMLIAALEANVGGSLPPSPADITLTMQLLLSAKMSKKEIVEKVNQIVGFPPSLIKKHLNKVQANLNLARLQKAVSAVARGDLTVQQAAENNSVDLGDLRDALSANGKRRGERDHDINKLKAHVGQNFTRASSVMGHNLSLLATHLEDGDVKPSDVKEVMCSLGKKLKRINVCYQQWCDRFKIHLEAKDRAVEVSRVEARVPRNDGAKAALSKMGLE